MVHSIAWQCVLDGTRVTVGICLPFIFMPLFLLSWAICAMLAPTCCEIQSCTVTHSDALWCTVMHCHAVMQCYTHWIMLVPTSNKYIQWDVVMHCDSLWCTVDNVLAPTYSEMQNCTVMLHKKRLEAILHTLVNNDPRKIQFKHKYKYKYNTSILHTLVNSAPRKIQSKNKPSLCILHCASQ